MLGRIASGSFLEMSAESRAHHREIRRITPSKTVVIVIGTPVPETREVPDERANAGNIRPRGSAGQVAGQSVSASFDSSDGVEH